MSLNTESIAALAVVLVLYAAPPVMLWFVYEQLSRKVQTLTERVDLANQRLHELEYEKRDSRGPASLKPTRLKPPPPAGGVS